VPLDNTLSDILAEAVFFVEGDGCVVRLNPAAIQLFGYTLEEYEGRSIHDVIHHTRSDGSPYPAHDCPLQMFIRGGPPISDHEDVYYTRDNNKVWCRLSASPIQTTDGFTGFVIVMSDITALKQRYETLDRRKNEFIAILAHEIRNPLSVISNGIKVLDQHGNQNPDATTARQMMARQTRHLTRLVDDLLDMSRINRGKIVLKTAIIDLKDAVQQGIDLSRPVVIDKRHNLTFSHGPEVFKVKGDSTRLAQVIGNLVNNAAKYTTDGGNINVAIVKEDQFTVAVRVNDNGMGIPQDQLEYIFDLFYQTDASLDRAAGGLGIGLTLVRNIMLMHGGSVQAYSDGPGKGSTFVIRMPVTEEEIVPEVEPPLPVSAARKILVVDDVTDNANSMKMLLKIAGHDVHTANNGRSAIALMQTHRPEVVILDIGMPDMNGYQLAERLKKISPNVMLIAVTGYGSEEDVRKAHEVGFQHHLTKPIELKDLADLIK
jgi:PAS domain S-box-containing protein